MNKIIKKLIFLIFTLCFLSGSIQYSNAKNKPTKDSKAKLLARTYNNAFDLQQNTVSNIQFYTTNYGIFGQDVADNVGGGVWPRGSLNQYIFGGGIWFAAQKYIKPGDNTLHKLVEITYNPNSGGSWMVPGRIVEDQDLLNSSAIKPYRTFFSTDFRTSDGAPLTVADGSNWPIWDSGTDTDTLKNDRYFGYYVADEASRDRSIYPKGPAFISGEDIFSTYKDTDLNYYDGGVGLRSNLGYPMRIQFEQMIYSWGYGDYKDFIFLKYVIINTSSDTLHDCWVGPVMDVDIGRKPSPNAANDRVRYYTEDTTLNLCLQWTDAGSASSGEKGYGFGFLGFDFLESPAVDANHNLRKDKKTYDSYEQLGLKTFKNWNLEEDINEDDARYNALSSQVRDGDNGDGDKRFMMATGPFNLFPHDTIRVVVGLILANPSVNTDADGTNTADCAELVRKDKFAQSVYDNNFRAPVPPDKAVFGRWTPLDAGMKLTWDSTSEISKDDYEKGLDFLGYRLYRARRSNLDTFNIDATTPSNSYPSGKGPLGWKQIATWEIPTPFWKSYLRAGGNQNNLAMPLIDSLAIVGPVVDPNTNAIDTFSIKVMRIGRGYLMAGPYSWISSFMAPALTKGVIEPFIMGIDTAILARPWGTYWDKMSDSADFPIYYDPANPNAHHHYLLDSVSLGVLQINRSFVNYNPLLWQRQTINVRALDTAKITANPRDNDTIYYPGTYRLININGVNTLAVDRLIPVIYTTIMKDPVQVRALLDSVYSYLQKGYAKTIFPDFEQSDKARFDIIVPYMDSITNHRTYVDIGDDNKDANISYDLDPTKTEKLINNVDYFYRLLAYDEGDYNQPTPEKLNNGFVGLPNVATTTPLASAAMNDVDFKITYVDSSRIGGLYNFRLFGIDKQRVEQLYGGHEFEIDFEPFWYQNALTKVGIGGTTTPKYLGLYIRHITLTDLTTKKKLYDANTYFEVTPCVLPYRGAFTEDAYSYVLSDTLLTDSITNKTISFGIPTSHEIDTRSGHFSSGDFTVANYCYDNGSQGLFSNDSYGTLGFSFDFTMQQWGGRIRPDTAEVLAGSATTPIKFITDINTLDKTEFPDQVETVQKVDWNTTSLLFTGNTNGTYGFSQYGSSVFGSFNNGPANYLVEFTAGGTETMTVSWSNGAKTNTFNVPYLTMKVHNNVGFDRPGPNNQSIPVSYPNEIQHMELPIEPTALDINHTAKNYPDPLNLRYNSNEFIGKYNLCSWAFADVRGIKEFQAANYRALLTTGPLAGKKDAPNGTQGRYYLTGISVDNVDTLDFVNQFQASGCSFIFDFPRKARTWKSTTLGYVLTDAEKVYGPDFQIGDKVLLKVAGGTLGLPLPGAKVRAKIDVATPQLDSYTDTQLNEINIVPNPYYITHQGQQSPYDSKIYFTRLPKKCTIDIYTLTGDLIISFTHDEAVSPEPDREGMDVWSLLSKNRERVQSQGLIAIITTPNGAQTIKKFAVVVGSSRIIQQ